MNKHISEDISHHITRKFVINVVKLVVVVSIIPIIFSIITDIKFDPAQCVNLYLSTICTSLIIAFTLQSLEFYRTTLVGYKRIVTHLELMSKKLTIIEDRLNINEIAKLRTDAEILEHYRHDILKVLINNAGVNEALLRIFQNAEFQIIKQILVEQSGITNHEKNMLFNSISVLRNEIKTLNDTL